MVKLKGPRIVPHLMHTVFTIVMIVLELTTGVVHYLMVTMTPNGFAHDGQSVFMIGLSVYRVVTYLVLLVLLNNVGNDSKEQVVVETTSPCRGRPSSRSAQFHTSNSRRSSIMLQVVNKKN